MEYYENLKDYLVKNKNNIFRIEGKEYLPEGQKEIQFPPNVVIDYCKITQIIQMPSIQNYLVGVNSLWLDVSVEDHISHTKLGIDSVVRFFLLSDINITDVTKEWKDYYKSKNLEENSIWD